MGTREVLEEFLERDDRIAGQVMSKTEVDEADLNYAMQICSRNANAQACLKPLKCEADRRTAVARALSALQQANRIPRSKSVLVGG